MHLLHQRGPLHDLPDTPEAYDAVLADVTEQALARLTPAGSLEHPDCLDDIGDTSLGITSLLALAWRRTKDPRLPEAVHRSLAFHLRERVYRDDNPGYPNLRIRDSGFPYARYVLEAGAHPIGDWPSTVWALLQAVDVLDAADGLVDDDRRAELLEVARGYWRWLTEATFFNPQEAGNQAIGCVVGGLMLARHLPPEEAQSVGSRAIGLYVDEIRARRVRDRGALLPPSTAVPTTTTTARSPCPSSPRPTGSAARRSSPRTATRSPATSTPASRAAASTTAAPATANSTPASSRSSACATSAPASAPTWAATGATPAGAGTRSSRTAESTATSRGCWSGRSRTPHAGTAHRHPPRLATNSARARPRWPSTTG
ncbi:hypothetical protein SAV14893_072690 [Streptomyces avermitilis]|uniref:Uncharacterized protein n=1 Tax=Streptomyces avermitilis TaxID=33903 RepID=A0A4D4M7H3_STRAX|nr:hypothetical protein SAV14893_072690 [Streptomyces avermitilis]GDY71801.1 hypothetical protein SAV31267_012860 [Streptomyces avermitilis]